jgi:hypothetical protein
MHNALVQGSTPKAAADAGRRRLSLRLATRPPDRHAGELDGKFGDGWRRFTVAEPAYTDQGAIFDGRRRYRYRLWRVWDEAKPRVAFLMLNPSTADEKALDPTVRRCLGYAQAWGFGSIEVGNIFALRSTDPSALLAAADPVGPANDAKLISIADRSDLVVCGWGAHGGLQGRDRAVLALLEPVADLHALRLTKAGAPGHPLYLPAALQPVLFAARRKHRVRT